MAKVKTIQCIGEDAVYNMEVESHHNYSVEGGLIFHNCRYYLFSRPSPFDGEGFISGAREHFKTKIDEDDEDDEDDMGTENNNFYGL